MPIFSEKTFYDLLDKLLVIHPARDECITGVGYDLTIGFYVKVNRRRKRIEASGEITGDGDPVVELEPDTYLVVVSREFVHLSCRVAATFHSKSSLAAQAIFMNSTTCDPNWNGRLIFLLYNASGTVVQLDLDRTFSTMVVQYVERRSRKIPTDPKTVLTKYIRGFEGDLAAALEYVMRDDDLRREFNSRVERVKKFSNRPFPLLVVSIVLHRYVYRARRTLLWLAVALVSLSVVTMATIRPQFLQLIQLNEQQLLMISIIGSIASIVSLFIAIISWVQTRRQRSQ